MWFWNSFTLPDTCSTGTLRGPGRLCAPPKPVDETQKFVVVLQHSPWCYSNSKERFDAIARYACIRNKHQCHLTSLGVSVFWAVNKLLADGCWTSTFRGPRRLWALPKLVDDEQNFVVCNDINPDAIRTVRNVLMLLLGTHAYVTDTSATSHHLQCCRFSRNTA